MDVNTFLTEALAPTRHPELRRGQILINALTPVAPDLTAELIRLDLDPYYNDDKLWGAVDYIIAHWPHPSSK